MKLILLLLIFFSINSFASGNQTQKYLLYKKHTLGGESSFNPINYYFNLAFDAAQNPYYFNQTRFIKRHSDVYRTIIHPDKHIKESGGYKKFFKDEFWGGRAMPNYFLHTIGGGYDFRKMAEWYDNHNFLAPYFFAFITSYLAAFGNEAIESTNDNKDEVGPTDHIADLLFFDWIGKVIFLNDDIVLFFRDQLHLRTWAYQPFFNLDDRHIHNAGLNYVFKPNVFRSNIRPFILIGMQVLGGISYNVGHQMNLSIGSGMAFTDPLRNKGKMAFGIFCDKNDNLLASLLINSTENYKVRLNIYPGLIRYKKISTGIMTGLNDTNDLFIGLNFEMPLGLVVKI